MTCIVKNCQSYWIPNSNIIFHSFPTNIERRNSWLSAIPIKGKFYKSARICSLHFKIEDYDLKRPRHLLQTAVPFSLRTKCDNGSSKICSAQKLSCQAESMLQQNSLSGTPQITLFKHVTGQTNKLCCRLCAQSKRTTELIDLSSDVERKSAIVENLTIFCRHDVDFTDESLPQTVCTVCCDTLNLCYMFLTKVRQSQIILKGCVTKIGRKKYSTHQVEKELCSDNDRSDFDTQNEHYTVKEKRVRDIIMEEDPLTSVEKDVNKDTDNLNNQSWALSTLTEKLANTSSKYIASESKHDIESFPILARLLTSTEQFSNNTSPKKCLDNTLKPKILNNLVPTKTANESGQTINTLETGKSNKQSKMAESKESEIVSSVVVFGAKMYGSNKPTDSEPRILKCGICKEPFMDYIRLRKHYAKHKKPEPQVCMLCDKVYKNKRLLQLHVEEHTGKKYECDTCGQSYNSKRKLVRHMRTATTHKPPKPLLLCNLCGKAFRSKGQLREHEAIIHKNETL